MTTTAPLLTEAETERRDAFAGRLFAAGLHTAEILTVYLGERLGLYQALAGGPATAAELASRTGTHARYVREWLEQQAVAGMLDVEQSGTDAAARRYALPAAHAEVLLDRNSLNYLAPLSRIVAGVTGQVPAVLAAFKTGGGVPYPAYGQDAREGQADMNRPQFLALLGTEWLPSIPDVHARLQAGPAARVADIGCGAGWSSIAIARAYPNARVDGFDTDEASIALAQIHAADSGVAYQVSFQARDAADPTLEGRYELVTAFETLHDMARPVEALRTMRRLAADGGAVIIADMRVADGFTAPGDENERFLYAGSLLFCLPTGMAGAPSAGTGAVMRTGTLRRYAAEAGFREVEVLPIEASLWRFYRLHP